LQFYFCDLSITAPAISGVPKAATAVDRLPRRAASSSAIWASIVVASRITFWFIKIVDNREASCGSSRPRRNRGTCRSCVAKRSYGDGIDPGPSNQTNIDWVRLSKQANAAGRCYLRNWGARYAPDGVIHAGVAFCLEKPNAARRSLQGGPSVPLGILFIYRREEKQPKAMLIHTAEGKRNIDEDLVLCIDRHRAASELHNVTVYLLTGEQVTGIVVQSVLADDEPPPLAA
jgi:hypothetical protein